VTSAPQNVTFPGFKSHSRNGSNVTFCTVQNVTFAISGRVIVVVTGTIVTGFF
jgi:hypothetical protein